MSPSRLFCLIGIIVAGCYESMYLSWPSAEIITSKVKRGAVEGSFTEYRVEDSLYQLKQEYTSLRYNPKRPCECFVTGVGFIPLGVVMSECKIVYQQGCKVGSPEWRKDAEDLSIRGWDGLPFGGQEPLVFIQSREPFQEYLAR